MQSAIHNGLASHVVIWSIDEHLIMASHVLLQEPQGNSGPKLGSHVAGAHTLQAHHSRRPQGCCPGRPPGPYTSSCHCHSEECSPAPCPEEGESSDDVQHVPDQSAVYICILVSHQHVYFVRRCRGMGAVKPSLISAAGFGTTYVLNVYEHVSISVMISAARVRGIHMEFCTALITR